MPEAGSRARRSCRARNSASIPARSFVVGDEWLDVELARAVGARGMLVRTGYGARRGRSRRRLTAGAIVDNLIAPPLDPRLTSIAQPTSVNPAATN